ncbi:MAG: hypothetical protein WC873_03610 [Candidatus Gracilibacteria bacterium]
MSKSWKIVIGVVMVVVAGTAVYFGSGSLFQGRLALPTTTPETLPLPTIPNIKVTLNPGSPSGTHQVFEKDEIAIYDVCNMTTQSQKLSAVDFTLYSDTSSLNPQTSVKLFTSTTSGLQPLGETRLSDEIYRNDVKLLSFLIPAGQCSKLKLYVDSTKLMNLTTGNDDLRMNLMSGSVSGGPEFIFGTKGVMSNHLSY